MKDNITPKLVFAIAVLLAVGFALWSGLGASVEVPVATGAQHAAFGTPF